MHRTERTDEQTDGLLTDRAQRGGPQNTKKRSNDSENGGRGREWWGGVRGLRRSAQSAISKRGSRESTGRVRRPQKRRRWPRNRCAERQIGSDRDRDRPHSSLSATPTDHAVSRSIPHSSSGLNIVRVNPPLLSFVICADGSAAPQSHRLRREVSREQAHCTAHSAVHVSVLCCAAVWCGVVCDMGCIALPVS
jgi:hypothetical protein